MGAKFALKQVVSGYLPSFQVNVTDNLTIEVGAAVVFGTEQIGVGFTMSATAKSGNRYIYLGIIGMNYDKSYGPTGASFETQTIVGGGYDNGKIGFGLNLNSISSGETSQTIGGVNMRFGNHRINYQNDWPLEDGGDRFRTAALKYSNQGFHVGFNLFTGDPGLKSQDRRSSDIEGNGILTYIKTDSNDPDRYRAGIAYFGVGSLSIGRNSEQIRHLIQNKIIHKSINSPYFGVTGASPSYYFKYGTINSWSLW